MVILTAGHGTLAADAFASLVRGAGAGEVVDVRRYPGSRRNPHFATAEMERWLPEAGVGYRWIPSLGGRRSPDPNSVNIGLRNAQFRAYADHMATTEYRSGVDELLEVAESTSTLLMCSEAVWWRCHRRLLSDYLVLVEHTLVRHLFHDGRQIDHPITPGARRSEDGVRYEPATA